MLCSHPKNWYFIHIPKNAGSAILSKYVRLSEQVGGNKGFSNDQLKENRKALNLTEVFAKGDTQHNKAAFWYKQRAIVEDKTAVGMLRNPWSRCLSIYLFSIKLTEKNLGTRWADIDHSLLIKQGFKKSWMPGGFFVDDHARHIEYSEETNRAWSYQDDQYSWLEGVPRSIWFKMEDGFEKFSEFTGLDIPPVTNTTKKGDYRTYYDDELVIRIASLFHRDIKLGNYEF